MSTINYIGRQRMNLRRLMSTIKVFDIKQHQFVVFQKLHLQCNSNINLGKHIQKVSNHPFRI